MNSEIYERIYKRTVLLQDGCIITTWKKTQRGGHTEVHIGHKQHRAHRLVWRIFNGPIPDGKQVNHLCHNPKCVNSNHLYLGTQQDNINDMILRGTFAWRNLNHTKERDPHYLGSRGLDRQIESLE